MITENQARELLARAAGAINVPSDERTQFAPAQRPRWIAPVVAAVAIAVALATGLALIHNDNRHDRPGPLSPTPTPGQYAGSVPPVFGYDGRSAQKMLEDRGLQVQRREVNNRCETPDRALRTKPDRGFPVEPGDTVTLYVTGPVVNACNPSDQLAWRLLDYANGRGPEPRLAPDPAFYINGKQTALTKIATFLAHHSAIVQNGGSPVLQARYLDAPQLCSYFEPDGKVVNPPIPEQFLRRRAYWLDVVVPMDGIDVTCHSTNVFLNADGAIDGIVVDASPFLLDPPAPSTAATREQDSNRLRNLRATNFYNFARGWMKYLNVAESVRLYRDGTLVTTVGKHQADDRAEFLRCPGAARPGTCGPSPMQLVGQLESPPTVSARADCFDGPGILRHVSGRATVLLTEPGVQPCASSWVVQVEYNDSWDIVAINTIALAN